MIIFRIIDKIPELPYFLLAFAYMLADRSLDYQRIFAMGFVFLAVSLVTGVILKVTFKTQRPRKYKTIRILSYGFPSLHSMVSIGAIAFVYFIDEKISLILMPIGALYIYSRIRMSYHTITDVVGGAALGIVMGLTVGYYGMAIHLPPVAEFVLAMLFFILPASCSVLRLKSVL